MPRPSFTEALSSRPWLLADGATGTNYFQMGLESGDAPEMWNLEHPERVRSLHRVVDRRRPGVRRRAEHLAVDR